MWNLICMFLFGRTVRIATKRAVGRGVILITDSADKEWRIPIEGRMRYVHFMSGGSYYAKSVYSVFREFIENDVINGMVKLKEDMYSAQRLVRAIKLVDVDESFEAEYPKYKTVRGKYELQPGESFV